MNSRQHSPIFKFFASVRLTVTVLLTLAATSVIGTVIPQNQNMDAYLHTYGQNMYRLFSVLDMFDMYHSWWFQSVAGAFDNQHHRLLPGPAAVCMENRRQTAGFQAFTVFKRAQPAENCGLFPGSGPIPAGKGVVPEHRKGPA